MVFRETSIFTKKITSLISDDEYKDIQAFLLKNPSVSPPLKGGSGIRKLRWGSEGRGKRGQLRIIYYWHVNDDVIYMLLAFSKREKEDLTDKQLNQLSALVKSEFKS